MYNILAKEVIEKEIPDAHSSGTKAKRSTDERQTPKNLLFGSQFPRERVHEEVREEKAEEEEEEEEEAGSTCNGQFRLETCHGDTLQLREIVQHWVCRHSLKPGGTNGEDKEKEK